jgi:hypothetical protein
MPSIFHSGPRTVATLGASQATARSHSADVDVLIPQRQFRLRQLCLRIGMGSIGRSRHGMERRGTRVPAMPRIDSAM